MQENTQIEKEVVIGDFTPKRKFLNFVSAVNGARIRFIRDIAFLKGERLSGTLEGVIFKVTICDEGTINFEEVDTNKSNKEQIKRLIEDIDSMDVTGYAQKFIVSGLPFDDIDGNLCYLEVEHQKPIDKLKSLFDTEEMQENIEKTELSERGFSILDALFSSDTSEELEREFEGEEIIASKEDGEIFVEALVNPSEPNDNLKNAATSYMEEQFRKMNEDKIKELKKRIEDNETESSRLRREISMSESKLKKQVEDLKVLETRLDSFNANDEANGYVFYVSEEQKAEDIGLTEENRAIADKIADIVGLKKDVLFKMLTQGHYKIRIADKSDITAENVKVTPEIFEKLKSLVNGDESLDAKVTMAEPGHFEYRGSLTWHQIVGKMIRNGFEQEPEFDKHCQSNSYDSHEEEKSTEMNLGNGVVVKSDGGFVNKLINVNDMKVLTTKQLETVEYYKSNYNLDITKNWFMFDTQSDDQDFLDFTGYNFFVTIQPEKGWDQDPSCEDFLPESIKSDLENYTDCVFGYSGDLSESEFIEVMNNSPFFNYVND